MTTKKNITSILYHVMVILMSAAVALALPAVIKYLSRTFLTYWAYIENRELFLVTTEIVTAVVLMILFNFAVRNWYARASARLARTAGLADLAPSLATFAARRLRKLKEEEGAGRAVMVIGSTGLRTFTEPSGDLHAVLRTCREAKVMLLNPLKQGVISRARSLADPSITPEIFREQIVRSIDFLKELKKLQKNIRLKLYPDMPLLKLAILGDFLFLKHYPAGLHVQRMPEYVFRHDRDGNLFSLFYQYFVARWFDPRIPEYDLATDELIYRDRAGREVRRERFNDVVMEFDAGLPVVEQA